MVKISLKFKGPFNEAVEWFFVLNLMCVRTLERGGLLDSQARRKETSRSIFDRSLFLSLDENVITCIPWSCNLAANILGIVVGKSCKAFISSAILSSVLQLC